MSTNEAATGDQGDDSGDELPAAEKVKVAADRSLSNRRVWAALEDGPDGICLNADGDVWCASMKR